MFAKFDLKMPNSFNYSHSNFIESDEKFVASILENYVIADGVIDASQLENDWFPETDAKVFLSHSHRDKSLVEDIAAYLSEEFRITSFIDSTVWGYADDLIKKLNDKYCKDTYTEEKKCIVRNRNASFAYVMLQSALMKMIDHCECFVFVHTSNSINDSKESTESIWLYNELLSASRIRARSLEDHRRDEIRHTEMKYSMPVEMNGFVDLSIDDFIEAKDRSLLKDDPNVILETLYINKGYLK